VYGARSLGACLSQVRFPVGRTPTGNIPDCYDAHRVASPGARGLHSLMIAHGQAIESGRGAAFLDAHSLL
jgi:hypothetical protein